jgi:D-alanyl-D-alanine dipeptidase
MPNKISIPFTIYPLLLVILSTIAVCKVVAQNTLHVISDWKEYSHQVKNDPTKKMVELGTFIPGIVYDLRYATTNNFMKRKMYPAKTDVTYLRLPAAEALKKVQEELATTGLGLKIFDAYRPYSVTVHFWELIKDERYVANPAKGSGHNRGIAVDLTIIDLKSGIELDMGTGFDNFTDTAHSNFQHLDKKVIENRKLLRSLMEKNGFKVLDTEWWHFFIPGSDRYELLNLPFKKFKKHS